MYPDRATNEMLDFNSNRPAAVVPMPMYDTFVASCKNHKAGFLSFFQGVPSLLYTAAVELAAADLELISAPEKCTKAIYKTRKSGGFKAIFTLMKPPNVQRQPLKKEKKLLDTTHHPMYEVVIIVKNKLELGISHKTIVAS